MITLAKEREREREREREKNRCSTSPGLIFQLFFILIFPFSPGFACCSLKSTLTAAAPRYGQASSGMYLLYCFAFD